MVKMSQLFSFPKKHCIDHVLKNAKILIDSSCHAGGNTNGGPLADKFFSCKNKKEICSVILNSEDRKNYEKLLSMLNVLLQVTQSTTSNKIVNVSKVKDLGTDIKLHLKK